MRVAHIAIAGYTPNAPTLDSDLLTPPALILSVLYRGPSEFNGRERVLDEYIEIVNPSSTDMLQFWNEGNRGGYYYNTWRLRVRGYYDDAPGPSLDFPDNVTLAPREKLLLVGDDPDTFRARNRLPASLQILGPWSGGELPNLGALVQLLFPDDQNMDYTVPYVVSDELQYAPDDPWPRLTTEHLGAPLVRIDEQVFGNEPRNWEFRREASYASAASRRSWSSATTWLVCAIGAVVGIRNCETK